MCGIHLRVISQEGLVNLFCDMSSEISLPCLLLHLLRDNELTDGIEWDK